jgi:anti-sigma factor ChrR (cupin superfamily)
MILQEQMIRAPDLPWERAEGYPEGTEWKVLRSDAKGKPRAVLLRLPPGFEMRSHSHVDPEHHYVLAGEYHSLGERFGPGTYRRIPPHADHGPFRSTNGAEILVIWAY